MTSTTVNNGQTVNNLDITNGNFVDVSAGGTANNTTIENGGFLAVEPTSGGLAGLFGPKNGGVANGVTVNSGGILDLRGSNSNASNIVLNGGFLEIDASATVTGSLTFGPTTGSETSSVVFEGDDTNFKPTISGFSASSALDDNGIKFAGATLTTTVSGGNTIATLSSSGVTNTFTFAGTPQLKVVLDNDENQEAVIVTTNTTTPFASQTSDAAQVSQSSTAGTQQASAPAQDHTVSALQPSHASQPAMSFVSQPHGAAPAGSGPLGLGTVAATHGQAVTAATQPLSAIAHAMALPQNQGLASATLGTLSQPQIHRVDGAAGGVLSGPTATTGGSAGALFGVPQHVATAAVTHTPLHIG